MALKKLLKILKVIDPKKLQGINDILEVIYPGIKGEIERLVERGDVHAMNKTFDYIKSHGGTEKMAEYYNNADKKGQDEMLSAFNKAFKPGAPFEDAVLTLDGLAKVKNMGVYTQIFGDIKDSIVLTTLKMNYRTIDDWRTFVRRQHEGNNDVLLGILDEIQEKEIKDKAMSEDENNSSRTDNQPNNSAKYFFVKELLVALYDYDNVVFKHISSEFEFARIIKRKAHKEKLVECSGKKVLAYHILWRLRNLLPDENREEWIDDIAAECGYDVSTISKKYKDDTNMKPKNKKLLKELSSLFDRYETLR
jgi:hypothetical protein